MGMQVVNYGMEGDVSWNMIEVCKKFFEFLYEERLKYMMLDMLVLVWYGMSFNQSKDNIFCWRDFLKFFVYFFFDYFFYWFFFYLILGEIFYIYIL